MVKRQPDVPAVEANAVPRAQERADCSAVAAHLCRLIQADTRNPGGDERAFARTLARALQPFRPDVLECVDVARSDAVGAYLFARWGSGRVLINVHMDTVLANSGWSSEPLVPQQRGDRIVGLGAADIKGAIAALLAAFERAAPTDLSVLFSGDEERSSTCMEAFLAGPHCRGIERAVVCEPTGCRVGTRHRGIMAFAVSLHGEGGHSSRADCIRAPVAELAKLGAALQRWGEAQRTVGDAPFAGMCMNVASIDGGVAFNIVPEQASLVFSVRPPPGAVLRDVSTQLGDIVRRHAPEATMRSLLAKDPFCTRDLEAYRPLLGDVIDAPIDMAFWTEAALLFGAGIDAVVFGPGSIEQAHAPDEWVCVEQLLRAQRIFEGVVDATR